MAKKKSKSERQTRVMRPHAAGMDIGAEEIYVAVPSDHSEDPVRSFSTFTCDLHALVDWLQLCGITTVAKTPAATVPGSKLAVTKQVRLVSADLIRSELFDWLAEIAGEIIDDSQVLLNRDWGVITALEFVQHHLA